MRFVYCMPSARDHEAGRIRDPTDEVVLSCQEATVLTAHDDERGHFYGPESIDHGCVAVYHELPGGRVGISPYVHRECVSIPLFASSLVTKAGAGGNEH